MRSEEERVASREGYIAVETLDEVVVLHRPSVDADLVLVVLVVQVVDEPAT